MIESKLCPCGCGRRMPEDLDKTRFDAGHLMEQWVEEQGFTMKQVRSANRQPIMVEARRRVCEFLRDHEWSTTAIGRFIGRDHTTVLYYLEGRDAG